MPVHNKEIAAVFYEYADLLEIDGANHYRVRAYRNAARNISSYPHSLSDMLNRGEDLSQIPGLGKDLAKKASEVIKSGKLEQLEELKKRLPEGLIQISRLPGLGPKRTSSLYYKLGITSLKQLEEAAREEKVRQLTGFNAKTEAKILEDIQHHRESEESNKRYKLSLVQELVRPLLDYLRRTKGVIQVEAAGSYRRQKETLGDLDLLVAHKKGSGVMERFVEYEDVVHIASKGSTRSTILLRSGLQVDLRAVEEASYGAALHYFTGSKSHNIAIRRIGLKQGLKINEYGIFKDEKKVAGKTENEVYAKVGLPYIQPELRENKGEIEAAQRGQLPRLITLKDIRGDLHAHTTETDGHASLEEMAEAARKKGYEYLAITDHSRHVTIARGIDEKRLLKQIESIDSLNQKLKGITILKGIEVDILEDGSLDLPHEVLKRLDLVVCAVHYKFNLTAEKQTQRIIKGIDNPYFTILTHPTGRIIGEREAYSLNMEELMTAARETGTVLEINSQPDRLDLTDIYAKIASEMGILISISTDAHNTNELDFMRFGVGQARRGWLETTNVLNTRSLKKLKQIMNKN